MASLSRRSVFCTLGSSLPFRPQDDRPFGLGVLEPPTFSPPPCYEDEAPALDESSYYDPESDIPGWSDGEIDAHYDALARREAEQERIAADLYESDAAASISAARNNAEYRAGRFADDNADPFPFECGRVAAEIAGRVAMARRGSFEPTPADRAWWARHAELALPPIRGGSPDDTEDFGGMVPSFKTIAEWDRLGAESLERQWQASRAIDFLEQGLNPAAWSDDHGWADCTKVGGR
jgi:hypothetical protein